MDFGIDKFSTLAGAIIIVGWSSEYHPGEAPTIVIGDAPVQTITHPMNRDDVALHYGEGSNLWGFRCYAAPEAAFSADQVSLRFPSGAEIHEIGKLRPARPDNSHELWNEFRDEVNATGGRILEVGSHPRQTNNFRTQFNDKVVYVGSDLRPGTNVDIAGDAHHLSDFVDEKFDYIFSFSTFEHFMMPWKVSLEMNKILRVGGKVFSHSHQSWPVHDEPWDYFRFSHESWKGLFSVHSGFKVMDARRGSPLSLTPVHHQGGPFDTLEHGLCFGNSVCVAQKIGEPLVTWDAPMSAVEEIKYEY